jgi:2-oxoisovalerate dehydrogenase E1 component
VKKIYADYKNEINEALKIRIVEERLLLLFSQGKLNGTVHTAVGQEFIGVFVSKYLSDEDFVTSNHRGHGHYLSRFGNIKGLIAELMGKMCGVSGGMGGSQHIVDKNYLSNGIQGGMLPIAAGVAYFNKRNKNEAISVSYIGDGTLGEGLVYETLNLAATLELPMLIILENNGIAQSTSMKQTFRGSIEKRVNGFGWDYRSTSSDNLEHLDRIISESILSVRRGKRPLLVEIHTHRLNSHSKGDDNRDKAELERMRSSDLINQLLLDEDQVFKKKYVEISAEIDAIVQEVEQLETLNHSRFVQIEINKLSRLRGVNPENTSSERYNTLIYNSLRKYLADNQLALLIGEDIQSRSEFTEFEYGGAFKVTRDLSDLFPERVLNSPISEAALFGFASGYSLKAGRTFAEIMFGDFTTLIFDQVLQHCSKFNAMYDGKVNCPVVVRTPMGGKRGYGPTHSQSIEKHFLGIDNFVVVALNHRLNPHYIYEAINKITAPLMIIENKILYTLVGDKRKLPGYSYVFTDHLFPMCNILPQILAPVATIVCYGEVLNELEEALFDLMVTDELFFDVICPSLISEIQHDVIADSLQKTGHLIIIEEGSGFASWGSEVIAALLSNGVNRFRVNRYYNSLTIPSSYMAEMNLLPSKKGIINLLKNSIK